MKRLRVALVCDDDNRRGVRAYALRIRGATVYECSQVAELEELYGPHSADVLLHDAELPAEAIGRYAPISLYWGDSQPLSTIVRHLQALARHGRASQPHTQTIVI